MGNGSSEGGGATALVGLDGFVVTSQLERDGEHWLLVETTADVAWCRGCGVRAVGNGRRRVTVRDLPIAGRSTVIVWAKRTWRCREELSARSSWAETSSEIGWRASLTERARREICRRVGAELDTVAAVAREFGVGWACAHQAVVDYGDVLIAADDRLERTKALGVDEHTFQHANARRRTQIATTFVDIERARLLDVVPGRSGQVVREWAESQPIWWADQIDVAAIDAFRGYATAIGDVLPAATLVIDHFHAIRLASEAVNDVRRRVQQDTLGHRGRKHDRSTGSACCCCGRGRTSPSEVGNGSEPGSPPATATARWPPCGWPVSCSPRSTPQLISPMRSVGWSCSSSTPPTPRSPS